MRPLVQLFNIAGEFRLHARFLHTHRALKAWRAEIGAPVPSEPNPKFDPEAEADALRRIAEKETKRKERPR